MATPNRSSQGRRGNGGATTATMEHNDAINNKQASWEACKLFRLKLKLSTSHKTHTKLCRIQRKTPAKVYASPPPHFPFPYSPRSGIVPGICAAKKFKCLCEINCCASPPVPTPTKSAFPSPTTSPFPSPTPAHCCLVLCSGSRIQAKTKLSLAHARGRAGKD